MYCYLNMAKNRHFAAGYNSLVKEDTLPTLDAVLSLAVLSVHQFVAPAALTVSKITPDNEAPLYIYIYPYLHGELVPC